MLRIISYNVHFGNNIEKIAAWANRQPKNAIYCFQEFPISEITKFLLLLSKNPLWHAFAPSIKRGKNQYGELTIIRNRHITEPKETILALKTNKSDRWFLSKKSQRSCLFVSCLYNDTPCVIANTQLACLANSTMRKLQIHAIIKKMQALGIKRQIIAGDFNIWLVNERKSFTNEMKTFLFETAPFRGPTIRIGLYKHTLDFVFGKYCTVRTITVERVRFSDHFPIVATVSL